MTLRALLIGSLLAASLPAAFVTGLPAHAQAQQPRAVLRTDVTVARETINLGDLVEGAGAAADTPVFRAPALGRNGTIQVSRVMDAARLAGLTPAEVWHGLTPIDIAQTTPKSAQLVRLLDGLLVGYHVRR